jgi:hypothetical protein
LSLPRTDLFSEFFQSRSGTLNCFL